jgi:hypothetical protein
MEPGRLYPLKRTSVNRLATSALGHSRHRLRRFPRLQFGSSAKVGRPEHSPKGEPAILGTNSIFGIIYTARIGLCRQKSCRGRDYDYAYVRGQRPRNGIVELRGCKGPNNFGPWVLLFNMGHTVLDQTKGNRFLLRISRLGVCDGGQTSGQHSRQNKAKSLTHNFPLTLRCTDRDLHLQLQHR